jgi:chemotaxis protein MotA
MGFAGIGLLFFFIFGVFVLHGGDLEPIIHAAPSELAVTIGGAAVSAMLIGQSMDTVEGAFAGMGKFEGP